MGQISGRLGIGSSVVDEVVDTSGSYQTNIDFIINEINKLALKGHKIVWGDTENWCQIGGKTFNINKKVYETRVLNPEQ